MVMEGYEEETKLVFTDAAFSINYISNQTAIADGSDN
jgi:hypothetical protein